MVYSVWPHHSISTYHMFILLYNYITILQWWCCSMVRCGMLWCGVVWSLKVKVWCGVVCGVWCAVLWCAVPQHNTAHHTTPHHITAHHTTTHHTPQLNILPKRFNTNIKMLFSSVLMWGLRSDFYRVAFALEASRIHIATYEHICPNVDTVFRVEGGAPSHTRTRHTSVWRVFRGSQPHMQGN